MEVDGRFHSHNRFVGGQRPFEVSVKSSLLSSRSSPSSFYVFPKGRIDPCPSGEDGGEDLLR